MWVYFVLSWRAATLIFYLTSWVAHWNYQITPDEGTRDGDISVRFDSMYGFEWLLVMSIPKVVWFEASCSRFILFSSLVCFWLFFKDRFVPSVNLTRWKRYKESSRDRANESSGQIEQCELKEKGKEDGGRKERNFNLHEPHHYSHTNVNHVKKKGKSYVTFSWFQLKQKNWIILHYIFCVVFCNIPFILLLLGDVPL